MLGDIYTKSHSIKGSGIPTVILTLPTFSGPKNLLLTWKCGECEFPQWYYIHLKWNMLFGSLFIFFNSKFNLIHLICVYIRKFCVQPHFSSLLQYCVFWVKKQMSMEVCATWKIMLKVSMNKCFLILIYTQLSSSDNLVDCAARVNTIRFAGQTGGRTPIHVC
jgi:hypothetical protein